jgi:hypothetical protein
VPDASPAIRDARVTERRNPRSASIDLATPLEIVDIITAEDAGVVPAVAAQRQALAAAVAEHRGGSACSTPARFRRRSGPMSGSWSD